MAAKKAVVIGAGRIGASIAAHLVASGYYCTMASHSDIELTAPASVDDFFKEQTSIDVLVNAAGTYGEVGRIRDVSPFRWREAIDVNLIGVYACCHYALPKMSNGGHIITLAGGGKGPLVGRSGLACSKTPIARFVETFAAEEPSLHINAIAPGPMYSRMQDAVIAMKADYSNEFIRMRDTGQNEVPVACTIEAMKYIFQYKPSGRLLFAREFWPKELSVA